MLECDRDKLKGGYFKFFSKIKQAKKEFKALKESKVYRLKDKLKFKNEEDFDLFIKNYALIENLLTHYEALNEVIVLNKAFVLEHFDEVSLWLNSKEFKEKYEDINHPYPPLLNPDKLNDENYILNYEKIPAEKAWEMNLPLPNRYKYAFFIFGASAHGAILDFFIKSFDFNFSHVTMGYYWLDLKNFYSTAYKDVALFLSCFVHYCAKQDYKRIYLASHLPFLILVRDPISRFKTMINHGSDETKGNINFKLGDDIDRVLDRRRFHNHSLYPSTEDTMPFLIQQCTQNINFSYTSTAELCQKEVYYIDASEINPDKVMDSMRKYAKFFDKNLDEERLVSLDGYLKEKKWSIFAYIIPLILQIPSQTKILSINIFLKFSHKDYSHESIVNEVFSSHYEVLNLVDFTMEREDFKSLKENEKLFNETKIYLNQFIEKLENLRQNYVKTFAKENDVLNYLKTHKQEALTFKEILDKELTHIKTHRPDIVASWKYYKEFEKMCEEFKNQN
ncbi:DUF2972 domain-containing protein [Campylobacter upsaliensis]|uniref:DUF2972 domain-containing protein n=1 Tax=Campylobacter upsaliensis TaxID=28080 RepID=UPI002B3E060F|nr:DUF2972 domain-containing protein [Campylobacter upsaliensis]MEB2791186.1 DUF2972 domain-containing protein [Campylobacter upsaliensis]